MSNDIYKQFVVREFRETDRDYITRTMLYSHFNLSTCAKKNNRDSFLNGHNKIINALLNYARCLIIADATDPDLIYSFIIYEQGLGEFDVIHYAHTRKDFRGLGLLKTLKDILKTKDNLALTHTNDEIRPARLKNIYSKVIIDEYIRNIKERI